MESIKCAPLVVKQEPGAKSTNPAVEVKPAEDLVGLIDKAIASRRLCRISDLAGFKRLGADPRVTVLSRLSQADRADLAPSRARTDSEFALRLPDQVRALGALGICIAGRSVFGHLMGREATEEVPEYDVFSLAEGGLPLAKRVHEALKAYPMGIRRTRTFVAFDLELPETTKAILTVKVHLSERRSLNVAAYGYDIGSSAAVWAGGALYLTGIGRLAAERGANVLDPMRRQRHYEVRLLHMADSMYDLALPHPLKICAGVPGLSLAHGWLWCEPELVRNAVAARVTVPGGRRRSNSELNFLAVARRNRCDHYRGIDVAFQAETSYTPCLCTEKCLHVSAWVSAIVEARIDTKEVALAVRLLLGEATSPRSDSAYRAACRRELVDLLGGLASELMQAAEGTAEGGAKRSVVESVCADQVARADLRIAPCQAHADTVYAAEGMEMGVWLRCGGQLCR